MLDELGRGVARRDLDGERIVQQPVRERADLVRERRREQQVLALLRQHREHAADVADEAHVEHAVGLVEHEVADLREVHDALVDVVEQAPGRGDDDVHALAQRVDLRARAHPAEDQDRALAQVAAEVLEATGRPARQLARGHQHQQARRARATRVGLLARRASAAAAARTPPSCRCRSARRPAGRGPRGRRESRAAGWASGRRSPVPGPRAGVRPKGRVDRKTCMDTVALPPREREPDEASLIQ